MDPKRARHGDHPHEHSMADAPQHRGAGKLPVTVLTGYLGAGKTTLLNYLLREQRDKKLAVIENEVGEVSIDDQLVEQKLENAPEELILLDNGCICCTIRGDLEKTLSGIAERYRAGHHLDGVLIELTGIADPAPVVQTFFANADIRQAFSVDNVVALVDAKHALSKLDESKDDPETKGTACAQIAFSSTVLLNKVDLANEAQLVEIEARIKSLNSTVEIIRCTNAVVPVARLFNVGAFNLTKVLEEQYMDEDEFATFYKPKMDNSVSNVGVRCGGMISMYLFQEFLNKYLTLEETAKDFLRVKAVLGIAGSNEKFVVQCVHMLRNQGFAGMRWAQGEKRENRIIFIGRGMQQRRQELTEGFKACITKPLRFDVDDQVQAKTGPGDDDFENGHVIACWDECRPYRIRLLNGDEVQAPHDEDRFVRAAR